VDKVLAAFTFVLTSDLIPKELAAFRKQKTRSETAEGRVRLVKMCDGRIENRVDRSETAEGRVRLMKMCD
jgi:hypothetical protein